MTIVPKSIRDEHYKSLDEIADERGEYDLQQLVPLLIDNVSSSALVHLAQWFSVLGVEGWNYADTDENKRALLKNAIQIHRKKGTPWSIKDALARAGFTVVRIEEGTRNYTIPVAPYIQPKQPLKFDGTAKFNGAYSFGAGLRAISPIKFNGQHKFDGSHKFGDTVAPLPNGEGQSGSLIAWALFRVVLLWDISNEYTPAIHDAVVAVIEAFKNARSWLTDVGLEMAIPADVITITELVQNITSAQIQDVVGQGFTFNGAKKFDGSFTFSSGASDSVSSTTTSGSSDSISVTESVSRIIS